ncbi:unnamed protein product [Leptosia nina]|uniref:Zinc finger protein 106 n=1 Tax=Leptosia nina TaxID=320188 RepID=A0AAV1JSU7_9NEOP
MRRGHQGIGGWRNENSRHYRSRNSGNPHFRPPRNYNSLNTNRFPPTGSRPHRPYFKPHTDTDGHVQERERKQFSHDSHFQYQRSRNQNVLNNRQIPLHYTGQGGYPSNYKGSSQNPDVFTVNSLGDIDQRQPPINEHYSIPPWGVEQNFHDTDDRSYHRPYRSTTPSNKLHPDYAGHRPPASDHYVGSSTATNDKSNSFSRSVDDTVNIVRKRLLNRGEAPMSEETERAREITEEPQNLRDTTSSSRYDQSVKKKAPKPSKVNCEKIKSKIVHQLFKMDKEKIHKLLDNPNSSTKFEYAINSLLTESQNSFNQHLRSVAEKSLCTSSKEFMQNDNNTIYEDTFMKQMQCILDPQDSVLLEDIKPLVMAELSNILQLDDVDGRFDNQNSYSYYNENNMEQGYDHESNPMYYEEDYFETLSPGYTNFDDFDLQFNNQSFKETKPLFERRQRRKSCSIMPEENTQKRPSFSPDIETASVRRVIRNSVESKIIDDYPSGESFMPNDSNSKPIFDANADSVEDEDTFAELDRQYHVAVDHDLIENDELSDTIQHDAHSIKIKQEKQCTIQTSTQKPNKLVDILQSPIRVTQFVKQEIDCQLQTLASEELECVVKEETDVKSSKQRLREKASKHPNKVDDTKKNANLGCSENITTSKPPPSSHSRKRSMDQRPPHRKEKRRKSHDDSDDKPCLEKEESNRFTFDKHINETRINITEPKDVSKNTTENRHAKDNCSLSNEKKLDKSFSEKFVKRKDTPKQENKERKRQNSTSSSHSISPKNTILNQTTLKADAKSSLKTIDMFTEVPKKINIHQAFRNTAANTSPKKIAEIKPKRITSLNQKSQKKNDDVIRLVHKEVQTLSSKSSTSRYCQTERQKFTSKATQTDLAPINHKASKSTDTFERMKEIDIEIQMLLQEKFKLYSSMENKGPMPMHNLGMTVLSVNSLEDNKEEVDLEDSIVNNFTNIPEEELADIALEPVETPPTPVNSRRAQRRNISYNAMHHGTRPKPPKRKAKTPNFSLIEQIITDDRPLEDIISLDDLEESPKQIKKKPKSKPKKKGNKKKMPNASLVFNLKECYIPLLREDLHRYLNKRSEDEQSNDSSIPSVSEVCAQEQTGVYERSHCEEVIVETVVADLQFDMLDVSEDIVIGESYDDKSTIEKETSEIGRPISEEIILDNSQSSMEEVTAPAISQDGECKLFDYSADENLQHDSLVVSGHTDAVLAIEFVGTNFLAACLDGNVYYFNSDGQLITTLRGSNLAVTCLCIVKEKYGTTVYTGSLDSRIRNYDLETGLEKGPECNVLSPIQTMDRAWDTVFVGTRTGFVLQFECKNNLLIPISTVKFSDQSILALRAMKEGPRKVLLVAARSENVTVKDAQTGLLLRTLNGPKMTVYTLLYEDGKIYCGTSSHQIHVFEYTSGTHVGTHEGGKGAVCLRTAGGLLFAGCYDGCIYVYREGETRPFAQIRGPSLMLLCLAVVGTKIIAGYKDRSLYIWKIPLSILQEMIL